MCNKIRESKDKLTERIWTNITKRTYDRALRLAGREPIASFTRRAYMIGLDAIEAEQAAQVQVQVQAQIEVTDNEAA